MAAAALLLSGCATGVSYKGADGSCWTACAAVGSASCRAGDVASTSMESGEAKTDSAEGVCAEVRGGRVSELASGAFGALVGFLGGLW